MDEQRRMTYAQRQLMDLVQQRKLKKWCTERNLPHATLYKLAVGSIVPSFLEMSNLLPYFAPAEWVYFTDEEIPYEMKTLEVWNPDYTSLFIKKHKYEYKTLAKKYDISEANAKNIFVNRRANVTLLQMRKMAKDVNPEEFFVPADETVDEKFYPEQGDIVSYSGKMMLVLSKYEVNKEFSFFIGIDVVEDEVDGIQIIGDKKKYMGLLQTIKSYPYNRRTPVVIDKVEEDDFERVRTDFSKFL